ncbi:MAG: hypothetical protein KAZ26_20065 [Caldilineaceae bacterium]|nr:hypothetical protein [Caldilineaceae bacterium]
MPTGQTRPLTAADEATIASQYRNGQSVNSMVGEWSISPSRLKKIVAAHGVPPRPKEVSKKLWADAQAKRKTAGSLLNAGSEAQLNNGYEFSTQATAKPPRAVDTSDVKCGWDGIENVVIRVAPGERTCMLCGEAVAGKDCPTSGCEGGELVDTVTALGLREGEWVRA